MNNLDLSIITPTYNTEAIIKNCIDSILKNTTNLKYEIILIDNGSTDGTLKTIRKIQKNTKKVRLVTNKKNLGFGRANNIGALKAKGEYLLFLNSDTVVVDNALTESVNILKNHKEIGVFSCRLLNPDLTTQESGGHFPSLLNLFAWQFFIDDLPLLDKLIPSIHPHKEGFHFWDKLINRESVNKNSTFQDEKPDWVTGAFMMVPKKVFKEVGGFDKNIFMYTEEMELNYRISKLGYKTVSTNNPAIIHLGKASGGSELAITSEVKNMIYFWQKHKPGWQLPFVKFAFFVGSLLRLILFGIIKQDEKSRNTYHKALKLSL